MERVDVLVVGGGPTGLMLACELQTFGVRVRTIDALADRTHESRAIAVQARTLEVLDRLGIAQTLVERGERSMNVSIHSGGGPGQTVALQDIARADTRFPYMLAVSQAETEAVLEDYLVAHGGRLERETSLVGLEQHADGVTCLLRRPDGTEEEVLAAYVAGCDGSRSAVRRLLGVDFQGATYPNNFVLADCDVDGLQGDGLHLWMGAHQFALMARMATPAPWRVILTDPAPQPDGQPPSIGELQAMARRATGLPLVLHDDVWRGRFRVHHRMAERFRVGRVFLAGDAAHIHSPAGGQGMNTGIQDACNLAWKLALVLHDEADPELLSSYEAERMPVARFLLQFTDRAFQLGTSPGLRMRALRLLVVPIVVRAAALSRKVRGRLLRVVSQLGIRYRRSPAVATGPGAAEIGPRAGDRLPDTELEVDGRRRHVQELVLGREHQLLLCGAAAALAGEAAVDPAYEGVLRLHRIPEPGRLGEGVLLVRPDGHIAYRGGVGDRAELDRYLGRWLRAGVEEPV